MKRRMINADCLIHYFTYLAAYNESLTFKQIIDIIEEEIRLERSEWTPVEEQPPEECEEVFITDTIGMIRHCIYSMGDYYTFEDGNKKVDAVAWMPVTIKAYGKGNENES